MKWFTQSKRGLALGLAIASGSAQHATAQFVSANNYTPQQQAYTQPQSSAYATAPTASYGYATPPGTQHAPANQFAPPAQQTSAVQYAPTAQYPTAQHQEVAQYPAANQYQTANQYQQAAPYQQTAQYPAPQYGYPRIAKNNELPAPSESVGEAVKAVPQAPAITPAVPAPSHAPMAASATMSYDGGYHHGASHQAPVMNGPAGCETGQCGTTPYSAQYATPVDSGYGCSTYAPGADYSTAGCDTGCYTESPACDYGAAAPARKRQWFAGVYGLYLDRAGDQAKAAVAYMTDPTAFGGADYYPMPSDTWLFTADADTDGQFGAEIRFGSTFGHDSCGCQQPFAWELGYWALKDDSSVATLLLPGTVAAGYDQRIYSLYDYSGLRTDRDGGGGAYVDRPIYDDDGMPADGDPLANDVRLVGVRVRQRFEVQNLELNFWRFGTPTAATGIGCGGGKLAGALSGGAGGYGGCDTGACGGYGACAPARPPRRFFINGLMGVRYMRVDDDFGLDTQFTVVDGAGNPNAGEPTAYEGFPADDDNVIFSDYEADNELVGFQLGCSMNWLVGCNWNLFCDSNFGVYGNNAEVYKRVYGGGDSMVTFANGGGDAMVRGSETSLSYVGELRAGIGYQVSCNCRLTAAYRFIGIGGVALGAEEFQNTNWANSEVASHIDTNNSIILHGVQTGVEYKY